MPGIVRDKLRRTTVMCHLGESPLLYALHWRVAEQPLWGFAAAGNCQKRRWFLDLATKAI